MPRGLPPWFGRSTATIALLWQHMPSPNRAANEAAFVVAAVYAPSLAIALAPKAGAQLALGLPVALLGVWAAVLLRCSARYDELSWPQRFSCAAALALCLAGATAIPLLLLDPGLAAGASFQLSDPPLVAMTARNLCVLGVVGLLLALNHQGLAQLGLARKGLRAEALFGLAGLAGAFVVHLCVSVVAALVVAVTSTDSLSQEAQQRAEAVTQVLADRSLPALLVVVMLAAACEEVVFRGFVLPRARQGLSSWAAALVVVSILFGVGHLYEGKLAVLQTAALGVYFGVLLIWRGRLLAAIVAHAGFNAVMAAAAVWLQSSGMLDGAKRLLP